MKKIFLLLFIFCLSGNLFSQIKQRSLSTNYYTGIGYKFVFLTDPNANDAYPFFQLSNGDFLKEIDGFLGVTFKESYSVEFAPSYLFTNKNGNEGFYYGAGANRYFYVPSQTRLVAVPINLRFKYFPFAKNSSSLGKVYLGIGGGMMYVSEEITSRVYSDDTEFNYLYARTADNDFWTSDYEFLLGIGSFSKIGFGFELSYRLVPLNNTTDSKPLISYIASNFNSVNFAANIIFSF